MFTIILYSFSVETCVVALTRTVLLRVTSYGQWSTNKIIILLLPTLVRTAKNQQFECNKNNGSQELKVRPCLTSKHRSLYIDICFI